MEVEKDNGEVWKERHGLLWQEIQSLTCQHRQMANPEIT